MHMDADSIERLKAMISEAITELESRETRHLWTWVHVDWDLLRDDIEAADNFPVELFQTPEEAMRQAGLDWLDLRADTFSEEHPYEPLVWEPVSPTELVAVHWVEPGPGGTEEVQAFYRVYRLEVRG